MTDTITEPPKNSQTEPQTEPQGSLAAELKMEPQPEPSKEPHFHKETPVKDAALAGMGMSVATMIAWFLLSHTLKGVGAALLITAIVLTGMYTLGFRLLRGIRRWAKPLIAGMATVVCLFVFLSVTIYAIAPSQLFYPHFDKEAYEKLKTDPKAEELTVKTADGGLSGWFYHNAGDRAPVVLYFPGNGENAATRVEKLLTGNQMTVFHGCNFAVFDYPGYGKSGGNPSERTLKAAGITAYDALTKRADVDKGRVVVFGYSIGTGVANYVASERPTAGLMLMAPYADGYDLFNNFIDVFHGPLRLLVGFKMEAVDFARDVKVKPLILASKNDEMVRFASSVRLSAAYPSGCAFETIPGIGHNDFWGSAAVMNDLTNYLKEVNAK